ncbi:MAG: hypothetical protein IPK04_19885 [Bdellovibrionales bacterium]|nr:hypothetical protein [Bdellovibrionales bacterium]
MLSVVFPGEPSGPEIEESLRNFKGLSEIEVVIVGLKEGASRAQRLNLGFHRSQGKIILFHHPRSYTDSAGIDFLIQLSRDSHRKPSWGGFTHQFDIHNPILSFTSWYSNKIRPKRGIVYLDHGIFFDRELWTKDIPEVDIFEDTLLCYEFRKTCQPEILPFLSTTSAIRFQKNGTLKQSLLNQVMKVGFHLNLPPALLSRLYEKGLELN